MEFMLEQQAKFQENLVQHDERLAKAERLLIRGAEMLAIHREANKETDQRITALVLAQQGNDQRLAANEQRLAANEQRMEGNERLTQELRDSTLATQQGLREMQASLKIFLDSMSKGGNGH